MKVDTIQQVVVKPEDMPTWAKIGSEIACGKLPTHISSQEDLSIWNIMTEEYVNDGKRPKYWIRKIQNRANSSEFILSRS